MTGNFQNITMIIVINLFSIFIAYLQKCSKYIKMKVGKQYSK